MTTKYIWIFAILFIGHVNSIMWHLEPNTQRCLKGEVQAQVQVVGEYLISEALDHKVDCSVIIILFDHLMCQIFEVIFI